MGKKDIIIHGTLHDTINVKALIEAQANNPSFLDSPKEYKLKTNRNYGTKPKVKRLTLSYKEVSNKKKW